MHGALTGPYAIDNLSVRNRVVVTNKTPTGLVRGFGGPPGVLRAGKRLMDRIAVALAIDPVELCAFATSCHRMHFHTVAAGAVFDSGDGDIALR